MSSVTSSRRCNEEENGKIVFLPKSEDVADTLRDIHHYQGMFSSQDKKQEVFGIEPSAALSCDDSVGTFTMEADEQEEEDESSPMRTSTADFSAPPFPKTMGFSFADLEPRPL